MKPESAPTAPEQEHCGPVREASADARRRMVPSPRHGWRVFLGEVGVIVLGVLLALGAQEAVNAWQLRGDVAAFRKTIDREIRLNLYAYYVRRLQTGCTNERLAAMQRAFDGGADGLPVGLGDTRPPVTWSLYRGAWDTRDPRVFAALPAERRAKYAESYDELPNNEVNRQREVDAWRPLLPYEVAGPLDLADRRLLHGAIVSARRRNSTVDQNLEYSFMIARPLGLEPLRPDDIAEAEVAAFARCIYPQ